jgi:hypothetical protein
MTKSIITRPFVGGIVAVVAGVLATVFAVLIAYFSGALVMSGVDVVALHASRQWPHSKKGVSGAG